MQQNRLQNIVISCFLSQISLALFSLPSQAQPKSSQPATTNQRLDQMFSLDIQQTLNVCAEQKLVNIAAGSDVDGSVICGDGFRNSAVQFTNYMNISSDFLAAAFLVGFRTAYKNDRNLTPQQQAEILALFSTPSGTTFIRQALEQNLVESNMISKGSTRSLSLLVNSILQRSLPILKNSNNLENLFGTPNQYKLVVEKFCTLPGISVPQAKMLSKLNSIQLYAICIQESGTVVSSPNQETAMMRQTGAQMQPVALGLEI